MLLVVIAVESLATVKVPVAATLVVAVVFVTGCWSLCWLCYYYWFLLLILFLLMFVLIILLMALMCLMLFVIFYLSFAVVSLMVEFLYLIL